MISTNLLQKSLFPILLIFVAAFTGCSDGPDILGSPAVAARSGAGDFSTIQGAIDASPPGSTIQVMQGRFQEQIVVAKNLFLVGSGPATIIEMGGAKVAFPDELSDNSSAVMVIRGSESCGTTVENMTFSGPEDGISVRNTCNITIMAVDAFGNGDDGIDIRDSDTVTVSGMFNGNGDKGVQVRDGSTGVIIQGSQINDNAGDGARIRESAGSAILDSTVSGNGDDGIGVRDSSGIEIMGNTITNNTEFGIRIVNSPDTDMANNTMSGNGDGDVRED